MYSWIDNILIGIKDIYGNNIYEILDYLNITVIKLDSKNILLRGNESLYYRDYYNHELIFIRNDLGYNYEKFILCHELGHAILHTNVLEAAFNKNLINKDKFEKQANYFAFKLLNFDLDPIAFEGFTLEQIASSLYLKSNCIFNIADKLKEGVCIEQYSYLL